MTAKKHQITFYTDIGVWHLAVAVVGLLPMSASAQIQFTNQTVSRGLSAVHQPDTDTVGPPVWQTGGMAVGDFNNDGAPDLFWIGGGLTADKLFINDGTGQFTDQAAAWGLDELHVGCGAAVGDYDGDGFMDIYVTSFGEPGLPAQIGKNRLYHNNGNQTFSEVAEAAGVNLTGTVTSKTFGASFGDYDLDGDLDLCVVSWTPFGDGNCLFRNNGDGTFTNVTSSALGTALDTVWGFQSAFADMNGDLFPELLISADFETSRYLINNWDGTFTDATVPSGTGLDDNGMGQMVGDCDNDGRLDWYVTSIYLDNPEPTDNIGNMLYLNLDADVYAEVSVKSSCNDGGWGWGTVGVDFDQDGWLDLAEVNGRPSPGGDGEWYNENGKLFRNLGTGLFEEVAVTSGFTHADQGTALAYLDADGDGDIDLLAFTNQGPLDFFENTTPQAGHWLQISLDTSNNPLMAPNGFGARITATTATGTYVRYMNGSPSYLATSQWIAHFGLGPAKIIDELQIVWSRGHVTTMQNVAADQKLVINAPAPGDFNGDGEVDVSDLLALLAAWGPLSEPSQVMADLDNDGQVGVTDLLTLIAAWG